MFLDRTYNGCHWCENFWTTKVEIANMSKTHFDLILKVCSKLEQLPTKKFTIFFYAQKKNYVQFFRSKVEVANMWKTHLDLISKVCSKLEEHLPTKTSSQSEFGRSDSTNPKESHIHFIKHSRSTQSIIQNSLDVNHTHAK